MRALDRLAMLKDQFGSEAAARAAALLRRVQRERFRDPADLVRLHEVALFMRAYPQNPCILRLADQMLDSFGERMRGVDDRYFLDPEISGIAGTWLSTNFSYEIARSLVARHRRRVVLDWDNYQRPDRLGPVLARLIPLAGEDWTVEAHPDWRKWFDSARGNIFWLLDRVEPQIYDLLEVPLRWDLGDSTASRSRARLPRRKIFYHTRPLLKRRDISIKREFSAPPITVSKVPRRRAEKILDLIVDASAVRYRELYGFTHPDLDHVHHADLGRGVDLFFFGVPDRWRLPLRAYHSGMYFKNGVPIGYVEGLTLFEKMEVGFNLYYGFRGGETAWLFARILKLFRQELGVTCFSVDSYQLGRENDEAIESGAFWFYRNFGFRPASKEVARLVEREEARLAANPGYRTPAPVLRRLAEGPLIYGGGHEWDKFEVRQIGFEIGRGKGTGEEPWREVLARVPGVRAGAIIRAKHAPEETRYLQMLETEPKLRAGLLRLGHVGIV